MLCVKAKMKKKKKKKKKKTGRLKTLTWHSSEPWNSWVLQTKRH